MLVRGGGGGGDPPPEKVLKVRSSEMGFPETLTLSRCIVMFPFCFNLEVRRSPRNILLPGNLPPPQPVTRTIFFFFFCSCDFVELLDSVGHKIEVLRGYKPLYTVRVDGNTTNLVKIRFDSDSSVRRKGFLAQYNITCK